MADVDWGAVERSMIATLVKRARDGDTAAARKVLDYIERQRGADAPRDTAELESSNDPGDIARRLTADGLSAQQIAERLGVSVRTVYRWRGEGPRAKPAERPPQVVRGGAESAANPVEFWAARLDSASAARASAMAQGHTSAAAQWERLAYEARANLDEATKTHAQEQERAERAAVRDPVELARRLLVQLPKLLEVADDVAIADQVASEIRRWRAVKAEGGA
jgi:transposase